MSLQKQIAEYDALAEASLKRLKDGLFEKLRSEIPPGLNNREVARLLGCADTAVSRIRRGDHSKMTLDYVLKMFFALGLQASIEVYRVNPQYFAREVTDNEG